MQTALQEVAEVADQVAEEQHQVARELRTMQRRRDAGWTWSRILDQQSSPATVELLRHSARRVSAATAGLARVLAAGLRAEGSSLRLIGQRLGVSHQRVSKLLAPAGRAPRNEV